MGLLGALAMRFEPRGRSGGRVLMKGWRVDGSRPMERSACESNIMPVLVLKHSRIIQRRVMRARELRVLLLTEPPPMSVEN